MQPNITAVANLKGGVGKSTSTVMLADGLAYRYGADVLVLDFDPQANSSQMLLSEEGVNRAFDQGKGTYHLLDAFTEQKSIQLSEIVLPNAVTLSELKKAEQKDRRAGWISIIPSHPIIRIKEMELEEFAYSRNETPASLTRLLADHIHRGLSELSAIYDFIIIDSPPYLSPLARAMLQVSSCYVTPTLADTVSIWGTKQFSDWVETHVDPDVAQKSYVLITRFRNTRYAKNAERELRDIYLKDRQFGPTIPESVNVLNAMDRAGPDSYSSFRGKYGNLSSDVKRLAQSYFEFNKSRNPDVSLSKIRD